MAGIEKGVLYRKTEEMLQEYRAMQARVAILGKELAALSATDPVETQNEAIEGMYYARVVNGMPMGTDISDKTGRIAESWRERYGKDFHRQWRLYVLDRQNRELELAAVRGKLESIETAINSLLPRENEVIRLFYIQGMKWEDVERKLNYETRQCKRIRDRAVWYMSLSLFSRTIR